MNDVNVQSPDGVTLVGAGDLTPGNLSDALARAPVLVAADGGANHCAQHGRAPHTVIGDFDSLDPEMRKTLSSTRFVHVSEQDSTDFEKCLTRIDAPFVLATGFTSPRIDHMLAAMSVMVRGIGPPTILLGEDDLIFAAPPIFSADLGIGTRVSLFPFATVAGTSKGLKWPIDGLRFEPSGQIGTSNETTGPLRLTFGAPGCLVITPRAVLDPVLAALGGSDGFRAG